MKFLLPIAKPKRISTLLFFLLAFSFSKAQPWLQTKGPAGGFTVSMFAKGDTLFAGNFEHYSLTNTDPDAGTLFRSADHGFTWERDSIGFKGVPNDFTQNGNSVFVSTSTDGIYRSDNNGDTWNSLPNTNLFSPQKILTVNGVIYVGTIQNGMYKSSDNGNSFVEISNGLPIYSTISAIGVIANALFISVVDFNGHSQGVYKSTDQGATWAASNGSTGTMFTTSFATLGNKLFAVRDGDVYSTTDLGTSWQLNNAGTVGAGDIIKVVGTTLFTTAFDSALGWITFRSDNTAASWYIVGNGIPGTEKPFNFVSIGSEIFTNLGFYGSIYKSTDLGLTFHESNTNLGNVDVRDVYEYGGKIFSASLSIAGVHASSDGGVTWQASGAGLPNGNGFGSVTGSYKTCKTLTSNADYLFTGLDYDGVYRSSDSGATWEAANSGLSAFGVFVNCMVAKGNLLLAGTYDEIFISSNNGTTWTAGNPVVGPTASRHEVTALATKGNYLYAGLNSFGLYRSADNGNTWTNLENGLPILLTPHQIIVRGNDLIMAAGTGVYISTDDGNTWVAKNNGLPSTVSLNCRTIAVKDNTLVTAIFDVNYLEPVGVFISTDNGDSWVEDGTIIKPFAVNRLTVIGDEVFAATDTESIWKRQLSPILNTNLSPSNHLSAAYPNPSDGRINLRISGYTGMATCKVINIAGDYVLQKELKVQDSLPTSLDLSNLAKGNYIIRLTTPNNLLFIDKVILK